MNAIEQYRKKKKITQGEFAELIGRTQATVSYYESGDKRPSVRTLRRLQLLDPDYFDAAMILTLGFSSGAGGK